MRQGFGGGETQLGFWRGKQLYQAMLSRTIVTESQKPGSGGGNCAIFVCEKRSQFG